MNKLLCATCCMVGFLSTAEAEVFYSMEYSNGANVSINPVSPGSNRYIVEIEQVSSGANAIVLLDSDDSGDIIERIIISDNQNINKDQVILTIRKNLQFDVLRSSIAGVEEIVLESPSGICLDLRHVYIDGYLGSPIEHKELRASSIYQISVGGNVYASVVANDESEVLSVFDDIEMVVDGSVIGGGVYNYSSDISFINIAGDVTSLPGRRAEIWSAGNVGNLSVSGDFDGRIGVNGSSEDSYSSVNNINIGKDFLGGRFMQMNSLASLSVGGNFDAKIQINSKMNIGGIYSVGGEMSAIYYVDDPNDPSDDNTPNFLDGARISFLPSDGLQGQVVVNSDGNILDAGGLMHFAFMGISDYLDPNYTYLSDELGGGAFGVAPFNFHQRDTAPPAGIARDCDPYHHEVVTVPALSDNAIPIVTLDHYGPVYIVNDGTEPTAGEHFIVEFKPDYQTGTPTWFDRSDQFIVNDAGTSSANAKRKIEITKSDSKGTGFQASGHWRITPVQGKVFCGGVAGSLPASYFSDVQASTVSTTLIPETNYWYTFRVIQQAPQSLLLDSGNGPSSTDLSIWLQDPYETNGDGDIDSNDFVDMAEHYGE